MMKCEACSLARPGIRPVYGAGRETAKFFLVGEAPGWNENARGVPFVGAAGRFLDELLSRAGIPRRMCYVTNVVKCLPPKDARGKQKKPTKKQIRTCVERWFWEELKQVDPDVIITLGAVPLSVFFPGESVSTCHGQVFDWSGGKKVVAMYHPAAALHAPQLKASLGRDFSELKTRLESSGEVIPEPRVRVFFPEDEPVWLQEVATKAETPEEGFIAFDFETTDLRTHLAEIVGMSAAYYYHGEVTTVYVAFLPGDDVAGYLRRFLDGVIVGERRLIAHNAKYELGVLWRYGFSLEEVDDTLVLAALLNKPSKGLKALALQEFRHRMTPIEDLIGKGKDQISMAEVPPETVAPYAGADAYFTLLLWERLSREMPEELWGVYREIERPLLPVVAMMEQEGVALSEENIQHAKVAISKLHEEKVAEIRREVKRADFNPNSSVQVLDVLAERGLVLKSSAAPVLHLNSPREPLCQEIIQARHLGKLTTYADGLAIMLPRAYGSVNPSGTGTGRFSYSGWKIKGKQWGINLQTIPQPKTWEDAGNSESRLIRRCFVADEGWVFVEADYSQIELRVAAHISRDRNMISVYQSGGDIHEEMSRLARLDEFFTEADPAAVRRLAKVMNFGLLYEPDDNSAVGVLQIAAMEAGVILSRSQCRALVRARRSAFPGIVEYYDRIRFELRTRGYVETEMGRRLYLPWLPGFSPAEEKSNLRALRQAVNMPIQGTSADMMKLALGRLSGYRLLWTVHDSVLLLAERGCEGEVVKRVKEIMEGVLKLRVPVTVSVKTGENLAEMEEVDV